MPPCDAATLSNQRREGCVLTFYNAPFQAKYYFLLRICERQHMFL